MSTAVVTEVPTSSSRRTSGSADAAIARRAFRQLWIGATLCAVVFGGTAATSALSYVTTFASAASRHQLVATTSTDTGLGVLLGPIAAVGTVGGYTVYKGFVFLTTIGAVWAVLATTRVLRGEEDSGRWQLVLAGATRPGRATGATLAALGAAAGVIWLGTTALTLAAAADPKVGFGIADTALYGASIVLPVVVFVGVGAVTSQLCRIRRAATGLGLGVLGVAFVLRMVADSGPSTHWLRWTTPFGWSELMEPFSRNRLWPLLPAVLSTAVLVAVAVVLAARRDAGDGLLASADVAHPRRLGTRSTLGLTTRLELPVLAAWCVGAAASGLMLGIIAEMTTARIPASLRDTLDQFGVRGSFSAQYFGVAFLLVATVVALLPAGQVGAAAQEETSGRLVHLVAGTTRRRTWFVGRLALTVLAIVVAAFGSGIGAWLGAESRGVDLDLFTMVGAGLNVVPTALVALGIGALVLAVAPRAAATAVYAVITWSLIIDLFASMVSGMSWLSRASLFHYLALAPAEDPAATTITLTIGVALVLMVAATVLFERRDLRTA